MKEFHIITVGTSVLRNAKGKGIAELTGTERDGDEELWREKLSDITFINELIKWVKETPREASAELNTFLRKWDKNKEVSVYLVSTKTGAGEICKTVLERVLKDYGVTIYTGKEISGYFWESSCFDDRYAKDVFSKDIASLLDSLIYLAMRKKREGFKVFFNPTGGLKAHVIACALAGILTGGELYYMHEEFKDVVELPKLFYVPKGREIELLRKISDKKPRSGNEAAKLIEDYSDEVERLEVYGLLYVEREGENRPYRVRITNKGMFVLREILKRSKNDTCSD